MNRNNETFSALPQLNDVHRSKFSRNCSHHTSFDSGKLIPFFLDEVLPGDTFDIQVASTVRMSTPIAPVMDDCYLDTYFFFVPARLCWNRWKEFCGENDRANWFNPLEDIDIRIPQIAFDVESTQPKNQNGLFASHPPVGPEFPNYSHTLERSLVDYFGLPYLNFKDNRSAEEYNVFSKTNTFNMLPFEAYNLIWNNFFRDKNYMDACPLYLQETTELDARMKNNVYYHTNMYNKDAVDDWNHGIYEYLSVKPVSKMHDYFTSMLPQPQRGAPVVLPGFTASDQIPVVANAPGHAEGDSPMYFKHHNGGYFSQQMDLMTVENGKLVAHVPAEPWTGTYYSMSPSNLWTAPGLSSLGAPTINDLRNAFAIQRLLEKDALGGSLYSDLIYSHFGVSNPDSRMQLPEYLGGDRVNISMQQVVQTSETSDTPMGSVAGLSLTNNLGTPFVKSFTEHGYIIGVCCIRPQHSYQNGVNRLWSRHERFDFYYPALANIGEQPVMRNEIEACSADDDYAIGYQEAFAEYRYRPSFVTSSMRTGLDDSLDIWHYADAFGVPNGHDFEEMSSSIMYEDPSLIDRTLAVSSEVEPQFLADFYIKCDSVRPMPLFSVPGLIDHH